MKREQYLEMRNKNQYSIEFFFEIYQKFNQRMDMDWDLPNFANFFQQWIAHFGQISLRKINEYYDQIFTIMEVKNKEGKVLKYV